MKLPLNILKKIHFIGIGGIGMSGIAEILHNLGYNIQGSDPSKNSNTRRLTALGVTVFDHHIEDNIGSADVVVISSAVQESNTELREARRRGLPVIKRAEMLAEIMRFRLSVAVAGTHGKTTTTSMCAAVLDAANFDPTVINGGIINSYNTNARLGKGDWIVVESDESDGTFTKLPATIGIITNIDPEHIEHYGSFDALREAFYIFIEHLPFYGLGILCIDHPEVRALSKRIKDRRITTYGFSADAEVRAYNLRYEKGGTYFDVDITPKNKKYIANTSEQVKVLPKRYKDLFLPMAGDYNVLNFLSTIAVAEELDINEDDIRKSLNDFKGVKRRFTRIGTVNGVDIIDDYAHHPTEIQMVLNAAKQSTKGRVLAVMQPHRYTRLRDLFDEFSTCFKDADHIILAPVFEAGETPITGISSETLAEKIKKNQKTVTMVTDPNTIPSILAGTMQADDTIIYLGAGNITQWAADLPRKLAELDMTIESSNTRVPMTALR